MKRENGTGCVRRLSGNRKRAYQAIVSKYDHDLKKQIYKSLGTFESRCDAEYELYKYINNKLDTNISKVTLQEIYDVWWESKYKNFSNNTIKYYNIAYKHMSNIIDLDITKIDLKMLQDECNKLLTYSKQIQFKILVKQLFDYAIANDYVSKNYANFLITNKSKRKIKKIYSLDEINYIKNNSNLLFNILKVLLYTGLRIEELLNLKVKDINLENKVIKIVKSKTRSGVRVVPIHDDIFKLIELLYNNSDTYLFLNKFNQKVKYQAIQYALKKQFKNHTFHEVRHTFITQCKKCNLDPYAIKLIVGHTVNDITLSVYTHTDKEFLIEEMKKFKY